MQIGVCRGMCGHVDKSARERERLTNNFLFLCGKGSGASCIPEMSIQKCQKPPLKLSLEVYGPSEQILRCTSIQQEAK